MYTSQPQVMESDPQGMRHMSGESPPIDEDLTCVFLADAKKEERSALRLLLQDLQMKVVGEASDWKTVVTSAPASNMDLLLVEMDLLPKDRAAALRALRAECPKAIMILLIGRQDANREVTDSDGADGFIGTGDTPEHVAEHLMTASRKKGY